MIVYIASYPRSGNFWMQTLLGNQFKRPTTVMHTPEKDRLKLFERWSNHNKKYFDIDVFEPSKEELSGYGELAPWLVCFTFDGSPTHKTLLPGCVNLIRQPEVREFLAKDGEHYFIKTHTPPYPKFFPGEYVIQIVRNPGATLWSYYNHGKDMRGKTTGLSETIERGSGHGSWSDYHKKWLQAAERLKTNYLQVRYEDIAKGELEFCDRLQAFTSLPIISRELKPFEVYHRMRPTLARKGKATGWEENYSKGQLKLLWQCHGELMSHFGYPEPNYDLGLEQELY